ncbi:universal stress protein [Glycocaulis profundi]|nr:universal stress protein [Glycocaulis profundi]
MQPERILVALEGGGSDEATLAAAVRLAPLYDADVRGVFVEPDPASYMMWTGPGAAGASVVSTAVDAMREEADKAHRAAQDRFNAAVSGDPALGEGASFRRITDSPSESAQQARLVRLMVACPDAAAGKGQLAGFTAACLVDEACPVFVPRGGAIPPRTICVAWDGSKEAAKAAFAATPLFTRGVDVTILHSPRNLDYSDRAASAPNRLANWLRPRGIEAKSVEVSSKGHLGDALLEAASGCDLLVSGAYGHSRIAQFIFGGTTRKLLAATDGPSLLVAH